MANANAVIIRKAKLYPRPSLHNLLHNSGLILATYWIKSVVNIKQAPKIKNQEEAIKIWDKWIIILRERYKKNNKNKRELRSDAIIIEEGLIVIGRDVVANENQIIQISNDFIKKSSIISYSREALEKIHSDIERFAEAEHLTAHANSIKVRFESERGE